MEDLNRIKARIESLGELGELVGALRSMAASRAREAQEAFAGTRAYRAVVEEAIADVALLSPKAVHGIFEEESGESILLVITSENGFVGGFNTKLIERALELRDDEEVLVVVGRRGQVTASEHGITNVVPFPMTSRVQGVTPLARRIAARLVRVASARIVFARHKPGAAFDVEARSVLPLGTLPESPGHLPPIVHLAPEMLLASLASEYLFAEIAHALMESLASENGARLGAMDAASRSVDDKLEDLRRDERVARQEKTTSDMLDVVTGAEAVNHR